MSLLTDDHECLSLHIGFDATLMMATQQVFGSRFCDEFSVLLELRSTQTEESSWHQVSLGVSPLWLEVYVDCWLVERVNWAYPWQSISANGLLIVGGTIEDLETPFEGAVRQITFVMGDPDAARDHCTLHWPDCKPTTCNTHWNLCSATGSHNSSNSADEESIHQVMCSADTYLNPVMMMMMSWVEGRRIFMQLRGQSVSLFTASRGKSVSDISPPDGVFYNT
ncbi:hypothetical protein PAMP_022720 [Pampus punctatissimus]